MARYPLSSSIYLMNLASQGKIHAKGYFTKQKGLTAVIVASPRHLLSMRLARNSYESLEARIILKPGGRVFRTITKKFPGMSKKQYIFKLESSTCSLRMSRMMLRIIDESMSIDRYRSDESACLLLSHDRLDGRSFSLIHS